MIEVFSSDFHAHVSSAPVLSVEFSAEEPSHAASGLLEQKFPDVVFAWIDPSRETDVAEMFAIRTAPALLVFREGIGMYLAAGPHSPERVEAILRRVLALDMTQVRRDLEREKAETSVHMQRMCPAARRGPL